MIERWKMIEAYGVTVCLNYIAESILYRLKITKTKTNIGDSIPIYMIWYAYTINTKIIIYIQWDHIETMKPKDQFSEN